MKKSAGEETRALKTIETVGMFLRRVRHRFNHMPLKPDRILLICLDDIYQIIQTFPALQLLKESIPDASIDYLTGDWGRPLLNAHPAVHKVWTYNAPWILCHICTSEIPSEIGPAALGWEIRRRQFQAIINFQHDGRLNMLAGLAGSPVRIGYGDHPGAFLLTHDIKSDLGNPPCQRHLDLLKPLGIKPVFRPPVIVPPPRDIDSANAVMDGLTPGKPLAVICPGGNRREFQWKPDLYRTVMKRLNRDGFQILLLGGPSETALVNEVGRGMTIDDVQIWNFPTSGEIAALAKRTRFYLGINSGASHIMTVMGVPSVVIAGSRHQDTVWLGLNCRALFPNEPCRTCLLTDPPDLQNCSCARSVTPGMVLSAYESFRLKT
ncbi:glycosyltransferase family 9 protein [bacterium]|nr:glycosyltransferase family 9 protein [candidate division CSSED10-310 bacterium]